MADTSTCPFSGDQHRYFIFKTYDVFEPVKDDMCVNLHYRKVEYAILGCNCSSVVRQEVKQ